MSTETQTGNPFANILQFYSDQAEKITPTLKQGIDDWYTVYNKIWTEGMRLQSAWITQFTGTKESAAFNEQAKNLGENIIGIQKELSSGMLDVGLKGIRSIIDATKKIK
ncbi:MAG: hypothetical protein ABI416_03755 [Ginsengibacter sp.]